MSETPAATHQTLRLSRGSHRSPRDGACVVELASLLAGEPFSDHPASVCPMIAAFLRVYNDLIDDVRRQDLYRYAAAAVGTRGPHELRAARARRAVAWATAAYDRGGRLHRWFSEPAPDFDADPAEVPEAAGRYAAYAATLDRRDRHDVALSFLDELIALGDDPREHLLPARFDAFDVAPAAVPSRR